MFYHHPVHGSQWEKPKGWVDQDQTMTTANTNTSDSTAGSGAGSGSGVGSSSGGSGSGSGGNNAVLPYGWSAAVDPASGRTFYYRTDQPSGTSQWDRPVEPTTVNNNNNLSQLRNNNNSSSSGNLSQHSGSGSSHSNNSNNNNSSNNNNRNNMTRSDKSVESLYTANSSNGGRSVAKRHGSVSELDKLKASQKEKQARDEVLRQLEEDNKDIQITQPSLYINTQVNLFLFLFYSLLSFLSYIQLSLFPKPTITLWLTLASD